MTPEKHLPQAGSQSLRIVYLTAGAAGMLCGSCLHDNTLARALMQLGHDVQLMPLYTPIRTDEEDVSAHRVYFGGINMYLQQRSAVFRWLPKWLDRWLDWPRLIEWASGRSVKIEPTQVADLTLSILRGTHGFQRKEVERLVDWLAAEPKPDVIVLSNMLTAGCVPEIKRRLHVPVIVTLQGDDIFLRGLPEPHQAEALKLIRGLAESIDAYIANSRFYADAMAGFLGLDRERIHIVPLGIDTKDCEARVGEGERGRGGDGTMPTIGYLARLAPEKGLHLLADAFIRLRGMPGMVGCKLRVAGWLGEKNRGYAEQVFAKLRAAGLADEFEYVGEVDRRGKVEFLRTLNVLAVPTTYQDPKGLFALEALAAGVPVVLPDHGAFPEMLAETQGGLLHRPDDAAHLAERLSEVLCNRVLALRLATAGRECVVRNRNARSMADRTAQVLQVAIPREPATSDETISAFQPRKRASTVPKTKSAVERA